MKFARVFLPLFLLILAIAACSGTESSSSGRVVFTISDQAPDMGQVSNVNVTVDSLRVHSDENGWADLNVQPQTFDLLQLRDEGAAKLIADSSIQAGPYDRVEIGLSNASVVDASGEHQAVLPTNKLQIKGDFEVKPGATSTADFDFLPDESLHLTTDGQYILAPVIDVEARHNANAQLNPENVQVTGGVTTTNKRVGTDIEGKVGTGLGISKGAVLIINSSGKIEQIDGEVLLGGTVKEVDEAEGTITITTQAGNNVTLLLEDDASITVDDADASLSAFARNIGADVITKYDAKTKTATNLSTTTGSAGASGSGSTGAGASGSGGAGIGTGSGGFGTSTGAGGSGSTSGSAGAGSSGGASGGASATASAGSSSSATATPSSGSGSGAIGATATAGSGSGPAPTASPRPTPTRSSGGNITVPIPSLNATVTVPPVTVPTVTLPSIGATVTGGATATVTVPPVPPITLPTVTLPSIGATVTGGAGATATVTVPTITLPSLTLP